MILLNDFIVLCKNNALNGIACLTGILGVWLTIKQNIWCWPFALISVSASIIVFYEQRLYGDMSLQVFYFFATLYGWLYWRQNLKKSFVVTRIKKSTYPLLILITLVQSLLYYVLLRFLSSNNPALDAVLTAASLTATYMMTKKWVENWFAWVFIDATYIVLYITTHLWLFAFLYFVFALMALFGWIKWKKAAF